MTLTLPTNWIRAFADGTVTPVWLVEFEVGSRAYFTVEDYALGGGDYAEVTYTPSGGSASVIRVTEGTDFDAETSDAQTAANMAEAFRVKIPAGLLCYSRGSRVSLIAPDGDTFSPQTTSDAAAWSLTPSMQPSGKLAVVSGDEPVFGYAPAVSSVSKVGLELDPVRRHIARPEKVTIELADNGPGDIFRTWITNYPDLRGKPVTIKIGWQEATSAGDFVTVGRYQVREFRSLAPRPGIQIGLEDSGQALLQAKIRPEVINRNHLEAVQSIFETAGLSAVDYDATSLDPTKYSDVGHWCVSWHGYDDQHLPEKASPPDEPVEALGLVNDLLELLDGTFLPDETQAYTFSRRSVPASTADHGLWQDDLAEFRQGEAGPSYDEVVVRGPVKFGSSDVLIRLTNENARHRAGTLAGAGRPRVLEVQSNWLARVGGLYGAGISAAAGPGTSLNVYNAPRGGFSGTRDATAPSPGTAPTTWTQGANTDATASRLVHLLLVYPGLEQREIVSASAVTGIFTADSVSGAWLVARYTIAERGLFGTTAQEWPPANPNPSDDDFENHTYVVDVTDAVDAAQRKLTRLAEGMPTVEFMTSLRELSWELGETVVFPDTVQYLDNGFDGFSSVNEGIFELIRKEIVPGGIQWKAALVNYSVVTPLKTVPVGPVVTVRYPPMANRYSLELDGSTQSVYTTTRQTTLDGIEHAAVAGWFRSVGSLPDARHLFHADTQLEIEAGVPGTHTGRTEVRVTLNGTYTETTTEGPIREDQWYHLAVLYDGTSALGVYVNNRKLATSSSGSFPSTLTDMAGASRLRLGASAVAANGTQWPGRLDEWAVFTPSSAADADDVARWFNSGTPPNLAVEPAHWWRFENEYRDRRGGGYLTPHLSPFFSGDVPRGLWYITQSGDFDGTDDYVDYGDVTGLDGATSATWSAWLYMPSLDVGRILHRLGATGGGFSLQTYGSGSSLEMVVRNGGTSTSEYSTGGPLSASTWHHVCAVYASSAITLYVDGASVASTTFGTLPSSVAAPTPSGTLRMNDTGGSSVSLAAYLSNVAFWSGTAASAAQVGEIYAGGQPPDLATLATLGAPDWWVTADGVWAPRTGSGTATTSGGVGFVENVA